MYLAGWPGPGHLSALLLGGDWENPRICRHQEASRQLSVLHSSRLGSPHSQTLSSEEMKGAQVIESIPLLTSCWSSGLELTAELKT